MCITSICLGMEKFELPKLPGHAYVRKLFLKQVSYTPPRRCVEHAAKTHTSSQRQLVAFETKEKTCIALTDEERESAYRRHNEELLATESWPQVFRPRCENDFICQGNLCSFLIHHMTQHAHWMRFRRRECAAKPYVTSCIQIVGPNGIGKHEAVYIAAKQARLRVVHAETSSELRQHLHTQDTVIVVSPEKTKKNKEDKKQDKAAKGESLAAYFSKYKPADHSLVVLIVQEIVIKDGLLYFREKFNSEPGKKWEPKVTSCLTYRAFAPNTVFCHKNVIKLCERICNSLPKKIPADFVLRFTTLLGETLDIRRTLLELQLEYHVWKNRTAVKPQIMKPVTFAEQQTTGLSLQVNYGLSRSQANVFQMILCGDLGKIHDLYRRFAVLQDLIDYNTDIEDVLFRNAHAGLRPVKKFAGEENDESSEQPLRQANKAKPVKKLPSLAERLKEVEHLEQTSVVVDLLSDVDNMSTSLSKEALRFTVGYAAFMLIGERGKGTKEWTRSDEYGFEKNQISELKKYEPEDWGFREKILKYNLLKESL